MTRKIASAAAALLLTLPALAQQSNVNLSYNPQKDTEGLIPFSASLNSPQVNDDHTVTFRIKAPKASIDNVEAKSSFKSPNISDGIAIPAPPSAAKLSAKLKTEEKKKKEKKKKEEDKK